MVSFPPLLVLRFRPHPPCYVFGSILAASPFLQYVTNNNSCSPVINDLACPRIIRPYFPTRFTVFTSLSLQRRGFTIIILLYILQIRAQPFLNLGMAASNEELIPTHLVEVW